LCSSVEICLAFFSRILRLVAAIASCAILNLVPGHACSSMVRRTKISFGKGIVIGNVLLAMWAPSVLSAAADNQPDPIKSIVDRAVQPVMLNYSIAGMAVGLTFAGKQHIFNYGVAIEDDSKIGHK
jgi:hypothetical protein